MADDIIPQPGTAIIATAGGLVDKSSATLALYADDLIPDAVSGELRCMPTLARAKGSLGGPRSPPARTGVWLLQVEVVPPEGPDEAIRRVLMRFPQDPSWWEQLRSKYTV